MWGVTAENIYDAVQAEVARLRAELEGMGRSLPLLLPAGAVLRATLLMYSFDVPLFLSMQGQGRRSIA
jgi:hypothetical protein